MNSFNILGATLFNPEKWIRLAWHHIVQSYRRTIFGPFWMTLNMVIFAFAMILIYGAIFGVKPGEYSGYIVCSMMGWWWVMGVLTEGGAAFLTYSGFIQATPCDKSVFVWSLAMQQLIALLHHSIVYVLMIPFGLVTLNWNILYVVPVIVLLFFLSIPVIAILAILFVRYRDVQKLVGSGIIILMMITPVFWTTDMITGWRTAIIDYNPLFYVVEILRLPLLGKPIPPGVAIVVLAMTVASWIFGTVFYRRYHRYIVFWL